MPLRGDTEDTKDVASGLPDGGHGNNPAVGFPVDDPLSGMRNGGEAKDHGEQIGGADVGTESPVGVFGVRES